VSLGIGTTTPTERLDVVGNIKASDTISAYGTYSGAGADYRRLALKMSSAGVAQIVAEGAGSGAADNRLEFVTGGTTRMTVEAGGVINISSNEITFDSSVNSKISGSSVGTILGNGQALVRKGEGVITLGSYFFGTNLGTPDVKISRTSPGNLSILGHGATTVGNLSLTNLTASGTVQTGGYAFADLPTSPTTGMRAYITDGASSPVYMDNAAGGGSTVTPVFYNGSNWINA
jgi:hypothetical protein